MASTLNAVTTGPGGILFTGDTTGAMALQTLNGNTAVYVDTSQNVGIGTTSPSYKLDVSGVGRIGNGVAQGDPNSTNILATAHTILSGYGGNYLAFGQYGSGNTYAQWIQSSYSNPTTASYNIAMNPLGGNVGIGTGVPAKKLHVYKTGDGQTPVRFETSNPSGNILDVYNDSNGWTIDSYGDLRLITGRTSSGSPERLNINNTGRIGVNVVPAAGNTFRVVNIGSDNAVQLGNVSNGVYLPNGGTSFSTYSDIRLKNITGRYETPLADITKLEAIKFTWKNDTENKPCVGVSAQSVELVVPEAIHQGTNFNAEGDTTEYLSVKYTELIPLMIASIQELKAINDTLTARIEALEKK
jgi:hypothetical protein